MSTERKSTHKTQWLAPRSFWWEKGGRRVLIVTGSIVRGIWGWCVSPKNVLIETFAVCLDPTWFARTGFFPSSFVKLIYISGPDTVWILFLFLFLFGLWCVASYNQPNSLHSNYPTNMFICFWGFELQVTSFGGDRGGQGSLSLSVWIMTLLGELSR